MASNFESTIEQTSHKPSSPDHENIDDMPRAIHFGAGNIGRGFIAPLLTDSGYHVVFADVNEAVINAINEHQEYDVYILSQNSRKRSVSDFSGVMATSPDLIEEIVESVLITTSV